MQALRQPFLMLVLLVLTSLSPMLSASATDAGFAPLPTYSAEDRSEIDKELWGDLLILLSPFAVGAVGAVVANKLGAGAVEQTAAFVFSSTFAMLGIIAWLRARQTNPVARGLLPLLLIIDLVLGSIYGGVTTISEAAAMGVVASLIVIFLRREMEVITIISAVE